MKLKRLLCALVVFTLMMTSVVCSVSAATYKTTTVYNVSDNADELGTVSLKTEIAGANPGSMVSYIIYNNTDGSNAVDEDGADIEYIDQKTVDADGNVTLGTEAKFPTDAINGRRYVFASSGGEEFTYETLASADSKKITNNAYNITDDNWKVRAAGYATGAMTVKYDEYVRGQATPNSGYFLRYDEAAATWKNGGTKTFYPDSTLVITTIPEPGYYVNQVHILRQTSNWSGGDAATTGSKVLTAYHVGNKMKLDLSDTKMGSYEIAEPGASLQVRIYGNATYDEATAQYIKVDSTPIYTTTDDGHLSVTFLMTKSATIADTDDFGVNVYAIPTTGTGDVTLASAEACFEGLKAEYVEDNKFGIQLITAQTTADGAVEETAKYFDSSKYDLVAVPYYAGTELSNATKNTLFYITDNETDLSDGSFVTVTE